MKSFQNREKVIEKQDAKSERAKERGKKSRNDPQADEKWDWEDQARDNNLNDIAEEKERLRTF